MFGCTSSTRQQLDCFNTELAVQRKRIQESKQCDSTNTHLLRSLRISSRMSGESRDRSQLRWAGSSTSSHSSSMQSASLSVSCSSSTAVSVPAVPLLRPTSRATASEFSIASCSVEHSNSREA
eukprot:13642-Heterococcus_DN1.PRE.2